MRSHYFSITLADSEGRVQSNVIRHSTRAITAEILNQQLKGTEVFQPVAITSVSYLGKMSDQYFGSGTKTIADRMGLIAIAVAVAALSWCAGIYLNS